MEKVLVLGGGIAGLTTAWHLSRTPALRERFHVTVVERDFRLGGKLASSRRSGPGYGFRNEEHGLHVWFGFYDNAFRLTRELYQAWNALEGPLAKPPGCPLQSLTDAFRPVARTQVSTRVAPRTRWSTPPTPWIEVPWPSYEVGEPGDGQTSRPVHGSVAILLDLFEKAVRKLGLRLDIDEGLLACLEEPLILAKRRIRPKPAEIEAILAGLRRADRLLKPVALRPDRVDAQTWRALVDVGLAFFTGLLNPDHRPQGYDTPDFWNLDHLNRWEFREWLRLNGAEPAYLDWSVLRALYDTTFQYPDGDPDLDHASFAAGTAARIVLRIATQYEGHVIYHVQSGMGEALISPLYRVLRSRGVRFRFLEEVTHLGLEGDLVDRVVLRPRAQVPPDWDPTFVHDQAWVSWPAEPPIPLQSDLPEHTLRMGRDFDQVVLAIPLGVLQQGTLADELRAADPAFDRMVAEPFLTPTAALQLWTDRSPAELGWTGHEAALVGWHHPLPIWADMSHLLDQEVWERNTRGLHYFCGPLHTRAHLRGRRGPDWRDDARRQVHERLVELHQLWPTLGPSTPERLEGETGRYLRFNVDPTECCVGSSPEGVRARLRTDGTAFGNLRLAGAWIKNGIDASCVEGAVMSGMQAARSLHGERLPIPGEDYLGPRS